MELEKIKSHGTADLFFWWLSEHPEITNIQGFDVNRPFGAGDNRVSSFDFGHTHYYFDVDWIYSERAMLNDWIDRYLTDPTLKCFYKS